MTMMNQILSIDVVWGIDTELYQDMDDDELEGYCVLLDEEDDSSLPCIEIGFDEPSD